MEWQHGCALFPTFERIGGVIRLSGRNGRTRFLKTRADILTELEVIGARKGEKRAFELLFRQWQPRLLSYAIRMTSNPDAATDVMQDVWLAISRGIRRLDDPVEQIRSTLRTLPDDKRVILIMFYQDELPVRDIALVLDIPKGTCKIKIVSRKKDAERSTGGLNHE